MSRFHVELGLAFLSFLVAARYRALSKKDTGTLPTPSSVNHFLSTHQSTNPDIELTLLQPNEFSEDELVNTTAFTTYGLNLWMAGQDDNNDNHNPGYLNMVSWSGRMIRYTCLYSGGFVLCAKDRKSKRIMATARVAIQHKSGILSDFHLLLGLLTGSLGFPWFLFQLARPKQFLKRAQVGVNAMTTVRSQVMKNVEGGQQHYLYLFQLATDPDCQGTGAGSELLRVLGAVAEEYKLPVYLETDTPRLRAFYERSGFRVKQEYVIPDDEEPFEPNYGMVYHNVRN